MFSPGLNYLPIIVDIAAEIRCQFQRHFDNKHDYNVELIVDYDVEL